MHPTSFFLFICGLLFFLSGNREDVLEANRVDRSFRDNEKEANFVEEATGHKEVQRDDKKKKLPMFPSDRFRSSSVELTFGAELCPSGPAVRIKKSSPRLEVFFVELLSRSGSHECS